MSQVMWGALMGYPNPGQAFTQSFQQGMDRNKAEEKEKIEYFGKVAAWADTPEKWEQAVSYFAQMYPEAEQFRGKFDTARGPLMAMAGILPQQPEKPPQDPGIIREYQIAVERGLVPAQTSYPEYVAMRNPGMQTPITIPHNAVPVEGGGNLPRVKDANSYNAIPEGGQYIAPDGTVRTKQGGQSGSAPAGNF